MQVFGSFSRLVSLLFRKNGFDATLEPTTLTASRVYTLPDVTGTVVTTGDTGSVTSTMIVDGTIVNADINASAAIAATKIADGSVDNTEFQYLNGVTSAIQTQLNTNATAISDHLADPTDAHDASAISNVPSGNLAATDVQGALNELQTDVDTRATSAALTAHTGASSGVHGVTGAVVGTTDSQSLTNKTLDDTSNVLLKGGNTTGATLRVGTNDAQSVVVEANNADRITARVASSANADIKLHGTSGVELPVGTAAQRPSSPVAGTIRANSDSNEFEGYLNGAWQAVGGGVNERPEKNYLKSFATAATPLGTISNGTVSNGGNRTTDTSSWASTNTSQISIAQSSDTSLRGSFNYLTSGNVASPTGDTFIETPVFTLEGSDLGKPVTVSFDVTGNTTSDDWDVVVVRYNSSGTFQERIPVAGTASTMTNTPSARIPTGTAQFRGFFVAGSTSTDRYALRFRRRNGVVNIRLDTLYVGPQAQLAGAPVTDWVSYTPTVSNLGAGSGTASGRWRRVGDSMDVEITFLKDGTPGSGSSPVLFSIPSGLTIDTTKTGQTSVTSCVGSALTYAVEAALQYAANTVGVFNTTQFAVADVGAADWYLGASARTASQWQLRALVPIAGWSSNVTMAERAVEEYASNSNTADADNLVAFANGAEGSLVPVTLAQTRVKRVRFQTPIQATDRVLLEVSDAAGRWVVAGEVASFFNGYPLSPFVFTTGGASTSTVGVGINGVSGSTTDIDVTFGRWYYASLDGATTQDWGSANTAGRRWRVRKVSGGAAVGYPINARNLVGDTSGTTVPAGYIGETVESNLGSDVTLSGVSGAVNTIMSVTLPAGVWLVWGQIMFSRGAVWTYATRPLIGGSLSLSTSEDIAYSTQTTQLLGSGNGQALAQFSIGPRVVISSGSTVVYLLGYVNYAGGSDTGVWASGSGRTGIRRVRIA